MLEQDDQLHNTVEMRVNSTEWSAEDIIRYLSRQPAPELQQYNTEPQRLASLLDFKRKCLLSLTKQDQPIISHCSLNQLASEPSESDRQRILRAMKVSLSSDASFETESNDSRKFKQSESSNPTSNSSTDHNVLHQKESKDNASSCTISGNKRKAALLHRSCKLFARNAEIIASALLLEPDEARLAEPTDCGIQVSFENTNNEATTKSKKLRYSKQSLVQETFHFPVNIALKNAASPQVVEIVAKAAPGILVKPDGPEQVGSLGIALMVIDNWCDDPTIANKIVDVLLAVNPDCAQGTDKHGNTPLHLAGRTNCLSIETITKIYDAHPESANQRNFNGRTPLQVAQINTSVPEHIVDLLQKFSLKEHEKSVMLELASAESELSNNE